MEPFSVAYAAVRTGAIDPSDRVAVLGGGPIGLLSAMAAVGRNASVTLIEPRPAPLTRFPTALRGSLPGWSLRALPRRP